MKSKSSERRGQKLFFSGSKLHTNFLFKYFTKFIAQNVKEIFWKSRVQGEREDPGDEFWRWELKLSDYGNRIS